MSKLAEIRQQLAAATPGPWFVEGRGIDALVRGNDATIVAKRHRLPGNVHNANATFIAASPENVAYLLQLVGTLASHLAIYVHAHQRGNSVPPHIEQKALVALEETK